MRQFTAILIAGAVLLTAGGAAAGEFVISQKKKRFTPKQIEAKLGDTVLFVNDDRYAHNLFSDTPGFEFDVRKQMPGDQHRLTLEKRGKFKIRCVIHPRMKMTVNVK
ncbi:MAG: cupredoxin domain-containing protein [Alphaproteobacteria bacterium]|jgi:plastocyanin|nr:cupredoxin domain-containing protein [Alphaproteobacteria bacterium]